MTCGATRVAQGVTRNTKNYSGDLVWELCKAEIYGSLIKTLFSNVV